MRVSAKLCVRVCVCARRVCAPVCVCAHGCTGLCVCARMCVCTELPAVAVVVCIEVCAGVPEGDRVCVSVRPCVCESDCVVCIRSWPARVCDLVHT